jgi:hypothetical protein
MGDCTQELWGGVVLGHLVQVVEVPGMVMVVVAAVGVEVLLPPPTEQAEVGAEVVT